MKETRLVLSTSVYASMLEHVISCLPEEACGMIGGQDGHAKMVFLATNELHSSTAFEMPASDLVDNFNQLEENHLDLMAIYHSHPNGLTIPSDRDLLEFNYPGVNYFIWAPVDGNWQMKAYRLNREEFWEIAVDKIEGSQP